jgi:tetratricopeptide (TPR) repeat protein
MATIFRILAVLAVMAAVVGCKSPQPVGPETEQTLLQQINLKFESPDAHYKLAKLYHARQLWVKAEYEYTIAMGFAPLNKLPDAGLVKLYEDWGRKENAQAAAENSMHSCFTDEDLVMLAKAFQKEGLLKYAESCYEYALTAAKNKGGIYKEMGYYFLAIGDKVRAEEAFRKSLDIRPYQPDVSAELGRMGVKVIAPEIVHRPVVSPSPDTTKMEEDIVNKKQ